MTEPYFDLADDPDPMACAGCGDWFTVDEPAKCPQCDEAYCAACMTNPYQHPCAPEDTP